MGLQAGTLKETVGQEDRESTNLAEDGVLV